MPQLPFGLDRFPFEAPNLIELHQASVHFPIALLLTSLFCDGVGAIWKAGGKSGDKAGSWRVTARRTQILGTISAAFSVILGWFGNPVRGKGGEYAAQVTVHQWWGIASLSVFVLLALWRFSRRGLGVKSGRFGYAALSIAGALVIAITGWLGGQLGG